MDQFLRKVLDDAKNGVFVQDDIEGLVGNVMGSGARISQLEDCVSALQEREKKLVEERDKMKAERDYSRSWTRSLEHIRRQTAAERDELVRIHSVSMVDLCEISDRCRRIFEAVDEVTAPGYKPDEEASDSKPDA